MTWGMKCIDKRLLDRKGDLDMVRIATFTHSSPYDGCFWEYQHVAIMDDGSLLPISWASDRHKMPERESDLTDDPTLFHYLDEVQIDEWSELYTGHANYLPRFWTFAQENGLDFKWNCSHCGETDEQPVHSSDYAGNGGVGITYYSWLCMSCFCELSCGYCGSVVDPDSAWWSYDEDLVKAYEEKHLCPSCGHSLWGD